MVQIELATRVTYLYDKYIYFANMYFNSIFRYDCISKEIEYVGYFSKYLNSRILSICVNTDSVYATFENANEFGILNYSNNAVEYIMFDSEQSKSFATVMLCGEKMYFLPERKHYGVYSFSLRVKKLIREYELESKLFNKFSDGRICYCIDCAQVICTEMDKNRACIADLNSLEIEFYDIAVDDVIHKIIKMDNKVWLLPRDIPHIYKYDFLNEKPIKYVCNDDSCIRKPARTYYMDIFKIGDFFYLPPFNATSLRVIDEKRNMIDDVSSPELSKKDGYLWKNYQGFFGAHETYKETVYLFPIIGNNIFEIQKDGSVLSYNFSVDENKICDFDNILKSWDIDKGFEDSVGLEGFLKRILMV